MGYYSHYIALLCIIPCAIHSMENKYYSIGGAQIVRTGRQPPLKPYTVEFPEAYAAQYALIDPTIKRTPVPIDPKTTSVDPQPTRTNIFDAVDDDDDDDDSRSPLQKLYDITKSASPDDIRNQFTLFVTKNRKIKFTVMVNILQETDFICRLIDLLSKKTYVLDEKNSTEFTAKEIVKTPVVITKPQILENTLLSDSLKKDYNKTMASLERHHQWNPLLTAQYELFFLTQIAITAAQNNYLRLFACITEYFAMTQFDSIEIIGKLPSSIYALDSLTAHLIRTAPEATECISIALTQLATNLYIHSGPGKRIIGFTDDNFSFPYVPWPRGIDPSLTNRALDRMKKDHVQLFTQLYARGPFGIGTPPDNPQNLRTRCTIQ